MKLVGKIKEAHGLKGEVYVLVFSGQADWWEELEEFGLGPVPIKGEDAPPPEKILTCTRAKPFKDGLIIKAEGLNDRNAAEAVRGAGFYVPDDLFISEPGETIYLAEILGFTLVSAENHEYGVIRDFSSNGLQDLLVVEGAHGTAEVPFVDDFLESIDFEGRRVVMTLPEGLFDLAKDAGKNPGNEE